MTRTRSRASERGQAIVIVATMIIVLIGFLGLAIDGGRAYWERRTLQNAVDAAALAASDNYQDSISISSSLHAAATEYAANESIYGTASANPSFSSTTVDITWSGSSDTLHIVTATVGLITTFDVSSNHQIGLAFMQALGVPSPITIGAGAQGKAKTGATSGLGLVTLATGACPTGTTSLSVNNSAALTVNGGGIQSNGSAAIAGTVTTSGTFADNCTSPVPAGVTATGGKTAGAAPLSDPGFQPGNLTYWPSAQSAGNNVVLQPGIYASSLTAANSTCYFLAPGIYQLQAGYSSKNTSLISNNLVPPDAPSWQGSPTNAPNYNNSVAVPQQWTTPGCNGKFSPTAVSTVSALTPGWYGVVITSTRTDYYPPQSMGGTAYLRESAPSTCHPIQTVAGQGINVTVNNVPGATGYNVYMAYNALASPCNQMLFGYVGNIANGVTEVQGTLGTVSGTFNALNILTLPTPANIGAACTLGTYTNLCAAATGTATANPPGHGAEGPPTIAGFYPTDPPADTYANGGGDRANSNDCQPRAASSGAPCANASFTPGAVQLYFPTTASCMTTSNASEGAIFSGIQYNWVALIAPIANTCSVSLGNSGGLEMTGAIYWPGGNVTVSNAGALPLAGQMIVNSLAVANIAIVTIAFNPLNTPPQGYSQISR